MSGLHLWERLKNAIEAQVGTEGATSWARVAYRRSRLGPFTAMYNRTCISEVEVHCCSRVNMRVIRVLDATAANMPSLLQTIIAVSSGRHFGEALLRARERHPASSRR